jgi:hypothetical protein
LATKDQDSSVKLLAKVLKSHTGLVVLDKLPVTLNLFLGQKGCGLVDDCVEQLGYYEATLIH